MRAISFGSGVMGMFSWIRQFLFGERAPKEHPWSNPHFHRREPMHDVDELAKRLGMQTSQLKTIAPAYRVFTVPKRSGGVRMIHAPLDGFKQFQRQLLKRVLKRLPVHDAATAFEPDLSIVHHARRHVGRPVVVRMDIRDFFPSITAAKVADYFRAIGWNDEAADLLTRWTTHEDSLPQGAPTSPKLANAVNYRMDTRIAHSVRSLRVSNPKTLEVVRTSKGLIHYSRYADDLTFSFDEDLHELVNSTIKLVKGIVEDEGYHLHTKKKLRIMRRHDRQIVTGLVVNDIVNLPRETRRRLRAIEHQQAMGKQATLSPAQMQGWHAFRQMVDAQALGDE